MYKNTLFYPPTDDMIAKYVGLSKQNILRTYKNNKEKENIYKCFKIGTFIHECGIDNETFIEYMNIILHTTNSKKIRKKMMMDLVDA